MSILHIAFRKIKTMLFNPVMIFVLVGLPMFQMFIMKTILDKADADNTANTAKSFVEITLVGLKISVAELNAASTLVQFLLVTGMIGATMLIQEREKNILIRVFSLPVSKSQIILGNTIGQITVTSLIAAIVITLSSTVLGIGWGSSLLNVILVTVLVIYVATTLGMAFSGFFKSFKLANGIMIFFVMLMTFMAGGFSFDEQFEFTGKFTINKWAFDAYAKLMDGQPLSSISLNIVVLAAIGTAFLVIAFVIYRRESIYE